MTASEFAFLALGLVLGVATGAALVVVLRARPPAREIRVTVEHDAVPRRAATLSADAFVAPAAGPARGGPADRDGLDRDELPYDNPTDPRGAGSPTPVMVPIGAQNRTTVSFAGSAAGSGGIRIVPERDPTLEELRILAARTVDPLVRAGMPTTGTLLGSLPSTQASTRAEPAQRPDPAPAREASPEIALDTDAEVPALIRILRGDHRALAATAALLAGSDAAQRRPWHDTLMALARALADRALREGWLDIPVGNPFWDTFTIGQCRTIAAALATVGYRFDGTGGWDLGRVPTYRDLAAAVAVAGLEPRRIRAWPTQDEIAGLYLQATIAADEYVLTRAPDLGEVEIRDLVGTDDPVLDRAWASWGRVRATLLDPLPLT